MAVISDIIVPKRPNNKKPPTYVKWLQAMRRAFIWMKTKIFSHRVVSGIVIIVLLLLGGGLYIVHSRQAVDFPATIRQKAGFVILYPNDNNPTVQAKKTSLLFDNQSHGISYQVIIDSVKVTISEQTVPDIFSESGVYAYKLSQARQYGSVQTDVGEVALTRPSNLPATQALAWNRNRGTLILAHALGPLTDDQWAKLFNSFIAVN